MKLSKGTHVRTMVRAERENRSVNGNPRFTMHFDDGYCVKTAPDASCAYGLENKGNFGVPLVLTVDGYGNVTTFRVAVAGKDYARHVVT